MANATLPSHVRLTVHQAKDLSTKDNSNLAGLHVVAKTVHYRHVTAKKTAPEWNEDFEFPLLGLDTVIKVSVKCKGKISDDKSVGSTFVTLRDFNILDRPTTRWYPLALHSKGYKEGRGGRGQLQLTVTFVSSTHGRDALDLATDDADKTPSGFKKFSFSRLSLRKSLRRQNSSKTESDFLKQNGFPWNGTGSEDQSSPSSSTSNGKWPLKKSNSSFEVLGATRKSLSLPRRISERPESLTMSSQNGHLSGATTPSEETPGELEPQQQGVVVRLRRRRTISGSHTPTLPSRSSSFLLTNGIPLSHLSGTMETENSGSPSGNSPPTANGDDGDLVSRPLATNDRLKRFERKSLRLRDYKPVPSSQNDEMDKRREEEAVEESVKSLHSATVGESLHGTATSASLSTSSQVSSSQGGPSPISSLRTSPQCSSTPQNSSSSENLTPCHRRNRSELSMESNSSGGGGSTTGQLVGTNNPIFSVPSDASQRLQLLSSSSSSLTVSSSASSHSLQPTANPLGVVANGNQTPPTPLTEATPLSSKQSAYENAATLDRSDSSGETVQNEQKLHPSAIESHRKEAELADSTAGNDGGGGGGDSECGKATSRHQVYHDLHGDSEKCEDSQVCGSVCLSPPAVGDRPSTAPVVMMQPPAPDHSPSPTCDGNCKDELASKLPAGVSASDRSSQATSRRPSSQLGMSHSHPSFNSVLLPEPESRSKSVNENRDVISCEQELKKSKLVRRHTVQYSKDVAKFHIDFLMDSVLPPSLMTASMLSPSYQAKRDFPSRGGETPDGLIAVATAEVSPDHDMPPRPHSVPHSNHHVRRTPPAYRRVASPGGLVPMSLSSTTTTTTTRSESSTLRVLPIAAAAPLSSSSAPLRRRASAKGMTKLLNLSAQALRYKSTTLPKQVRNHESDSLEMLGTESSQSGLRNDSTAVAADRSNTGGGGGKRGRKSSSSVDGKNGTPSSRASSISMTSTNSRKDLAEMSREELLGEVLSRAEEIRELKEQLSIIKSYNTSLLEKVILHCPELLDTSGSF